MNFNIKWLWILNLTTIEEFANVNWIQIVSVTVCVKSIVRGYNIYKLDCCPNVGDKIQGEIEKQIAMLDTQ